jgi:ubiquinone/menaquinone biosynthesis C-methylase UbiE
MDDRIEREKSFHNSRFSTEPSRSKALASRMFSITKEALNATYAKIEAGTSGKRVLEYGCGQGEASLIIAKKYNPKSVVGIDISDVAAHQARSEAAAVGLDNVSFEVMNAEEMDFPDDEFDFVCGFGILHHLRLAIALRELTRVLKPDGSCIFLEPLGHNPAINLYRWFTPNMRTEDEHPLLLKDFAIFQQHFSCIDPVFVNLTTLATLPFSRLPGSSKLLRGAAGFDKVLFRVLPFTRRFAWNVVLIFSEPQKSSQSRISSQLADSIS